jgi:hypothetical protein
MTFLLLRPSPTDNAFRQLCDIPQPHLWRRDVFGRRVEVPVGNKGHHRHDDTVTALFRPAAAPVARRVRIINKHPGTLRSRVSLPNR